MILSQGDNSKILVPAIFIVISSMPVIVNQNIH